MKEQTKTEEDEEALEQLQNMQSRLFSNKSGQSIKMWEQKVTTPPQLVSVSSKGDAIRELLEAA